MFEFRFSYIGLNDSGTKVEGVKFALNAKVIVRELSNKGITEIRVRKIFNSLDDMRMSTSKLNDENLSYLFDEMESLIKLGTNMTDTLKFLKNSTDKKEIKELVQDISGEVSSGSKLSTSLTNSGKIDNFAIVIIRVAEETGNYDTALGALAEYYKDKGEISGKIKGAMIKPIITFIALGGASFYLIMNVIPKIGSLFEGTPIEPPFTTQVLMDIEVYLREYPLIIMGIVIGVVFGIITFFKNEKTSKYKMKLPIIGKVKKMSFQAEFLMSYYLLLNHGVQTTRAIEIIKENITDPHYLKFYEKTIVSLTGGTQLSTILLNTEDLFDQIIGYMFRKGEMSGTTNEVAGKLYQNYKTKTAKYLEHFPLILDTATLAIGGGILIFIFSGIIFPVLSFIQNMGKM